MEKELLWYLTNIEQRKARDIVACLIDLGCRVNELLDYLLINEYREAYDIVCCLIDLGCRVNELLNLEKRFVDYDNNQINFNDRKNDQAVAVPMTNRVQAKIERYYKQTKDFDKLFRN